MSFHADNAWQRTVRDTVLAPGFYGRYATDGRYVFIDKGHLATVLQKRYAVDTIVQGKDGAAVCIEEKIVRWPKSGVAHSAYALETHSCTKPGRESPGWMRYGLADYLLYCFQQEDGALDCHLIDFLKLRQWFWENEDRFSVFGPLATLNGTKGRGRPHRCRCRGGASLAPVHRRTALGSSTGVGGRMNPLPTEALFRSQPAKPAASSLGTAGQLAALMPAILLHDSLFRQRNHWDGTRWVPRPPERWDGCRWLPLAEGGAS